MYCRFEYSNLCYLVCFVFAGYSQVHLPRRWYAHLWYHRPRSVGRGDAVLLGLRRERGHRRLHVRIWMIMLSLLSPFEHSPLFLFRVTLLCCPAGPLVLSWRRQQTTLSHTRNRWLLLEHVIQRTVGPLQNAVLHSQLDWLVCLPINSSKNSDSFVRASMHSVRLPWLPSHLSQSLTSVSIKNCTLRVPNKTTTLFLVWAIIKAIFTIRSFSVGNPVGCLVVKMQVGEFTF